MIKGEQVNITVDFANVISPYTGIFNPSVVVANQATTEFVPSAIIGPVTTNGSIMSLTLSSAPLRPKSTYVITLSGSTTNISGSAFGVVIPTRTGKVVVPSSLITWAPSGAPAITLVINLKVIY